MLNQPQVPDKCPRCGSTQFQLAKIGQYNVISNGGYQSLTKLHDVMVCLCGHTVLIERPQRREDRQSLQNSLEAAQKYRERAGPEQIKAELERDFVTHAEFEALSERVSTLEAFLQQLTDTDQHEGQENGSGDHAK